MYASKYILSQTTIVKPNQNLLISSKKTEFTELPVERIPSIGLKPCFFQLSVDCRLPFASLRLFEEFSQLPKQNEFEFKCLYPVFILLMNHSAKNFLSISQKSIACCLIHQKKIMTSSQGNQKSWVNVTSGHFIHDKEQLNTLQLNAAKSYVVNVKRGQFGDLNLSRNRLLSQYTTEFFTN